MKPCAWHAGASAEIRLLVWCLASHWMTVSSSGWVACYTSCHLELLEVTLNAWPSVRINTRWSCYSSMPAVTALTWLLFIYEWMNMWMDDCMHEWVMDWLDGIMAAGTGWWWEPSGGCGQADCWGSCSRSCPAGAEGGRSCLPVQNCSVGGRAHAHWGAVLQCPGNYNNNK